jgi:thiol-disulfide isomerase/thioredoxin
MSIVISNVADHNRVIDEYDRLVIFFGSSSCSHCRNMAPIFEKLAREYPSVAFAKVDISKVKVANVDAVPVFVGYKNGVPVEVMLGATRDELIKMIKNDL